MNYTLKNEKLEIVISSRGAELQSIVRDGFNYLWSGDPTYWEDRAPILFPYDGRLTNNSYTFKGKTYEMFIHGFGRSVEYEVEEQTEDQITFVFKSNEETKKGYPFDFTLIQKYELKDDTIAISYIVKNESDEMMYFGIGGHPGFNVPFDGQGDFSDYYLEFAAPCQPQSIGFTPTCYLSGADSEFPLEDRKVLKLEHKMFDDDAIFLRHTETEVTLKSDCTDRSVTVSYPDFTILGLWHAPKTEAPYICIEPWSSLPSRQDVVEDLGQQSNLLRLRAGKTYENYWSIRIQ